eukprot:6214172-Pleurochrysis_carterae.AAC.6
MRNLNEQTAKLRAKTTSHSLPPPRSSHSAMHPPRSMVCVPPQVQDAGLIFLSSMADTLVAGTQARQFGSELQFSFWTREALCPHFSCIPQQAWFLICSEYVLSKVPFDSTHDAARPFTLSCRAGSDTY